MVGKKTAVEAGVERATHTELFLISRLLVVVLKIIKPAAGFAMASLCTNVILGGRNPCVVDDTSSTAEVLGESTPIPTLPPSG
jgi:hypothetical protein